MTEIARETWRQWLTTDTPQSRRQARMAQL
jgi:hypothetical protein